jgi:hypothetical protein
VIKSFKSSAERIRLILSVTIIQGEEGEEEEEEEAAEEG